MQAQQYWNEVGSQKEFEDPLYLDKLSSYLSPNSRILEFGCGYGRLLQLLSSKGYHNIIGFDFAQNMIARGKKLYPHLDMQLIDSMKTLPLDNASVDAIVMSTVLCCILEDSKQKELIADLSRVLKKKGILYLSDFLLCDHPVYFQKYAEGFDLFGSQGTYKTSENLVVRHFTTAQVMNLLNDFDIQWFEQGDFKTMNDNPARTFHCIAQKND